MIRNPQILNDYTIIRRLGTKTVGRKDRYTVDTFLAVNKQDLGEYVIKRYSEPTADMEDAAVTTYNTRSALYFDVIEVGDMPECQPGIVCFETAFSDPKEEAFYLITGKVPGVDLSEVMNQIQTCQLNPSTHDILLVMRALADLVDTLHRQGMVHRNLSPGNIRLDFETGQAWLVDLDFSCFTFEREMEDMFIPAICQDTGYGNIWWYPDPEMEMWEYETTVPYRLFRPGVLEKSDVFALGSIFYTMATGLRLFPGTGQAYRSALRKGRKFIAQLSADPVLNQMLGNLIDNMTDLSPDSRPTAAQVRSRLDTILNSVYDPNRMDTDEFSDCLRIQCTCTAVASAPAVASATDTVTY